MSHHSHHVRRDLPLLLVGSYFLGYVAGRSFGLIWVSGAATRRRAQRRTTHQVPAAIGTSAVAIHQVISGFLLIARTAAMPTR